LKPTSKENGTNQFEIAIKNKGRFARNSNNSIKGGVILNKTRTKGRAGSEELREMPRTDLTYSQGINRMWSRKTRFDFYWPAFAHLGEQAVLQKEIYFNSDSDGEDEHKSI
jgi:hypothetical protein